MHIQNDILTEEIIALPRRRALLPLWIKIFIWIFMISSLVVPIAILLGIFGGTMDISIYGFETNDPFSSLGIFLLGLFLFKGIVSYMMYTEKEQAINLAFVDALLGVSLCTYHMINNYLTIGGVSIRLEIVVFIPYIIKLLRIREPWRIATPKQ